MKLGPFVITVSFWHSLHLFQGDPGPPGLPGQREKVGRRGKRGPPGDAIVGILQEDDMCDEKNAGLLRFNSTSSMQNLLVCDGKSWKVRILLSRRAHSVMILCLCYVYNAHLSHLYCLSIVHQPGGLLIVTVDGTGLLESKMNSFSFTNTYIDLISLQLQCVAGLELVHAFCSCKTLADL